MRSEKAMAITLHDLEAMAIRNSHHQSYNKPETLSSRIDYLLAGLLVGLYYPHTFLPERAMILDCIDGLLRLKIDIRRNKRGNYGC